MKAIVLCYTNRYAEVVDIPKRLEESYLNGKISDTELMDDLGYSSGNIHYMFSYDNIPVYEYGNEVPVVVL